MARIGWQRVSRREPCPVCGKPDNCTVSIDGKFAYCGRVADGSVKENDGGQWLHVLRDDGDDWNDRGWVDPRVSLKNLQPQKASPIWKKLADNAFAHPEAEVQRQRLADEFGVNVSVLERLRVGWQQPSRKLPRWTIPERDPSGAVIGLSTRLTNGDKLVEIGGRRGLTFTDDWQDGDGPILLVEGASDVAALTHMGCSTVGRPSNTGGAEHLCVLLRDVPDDRDVIVIGENDRKSQDSLAPSKQKWHSDDCDGCTTCWPGKAGALQTAEKLRNALCRDIAVCLPPDDAKDAREWLHLMQGEAVN